MRILHSSDYDKTFHHFSIQKNIQKPHIKVIKWENYLNLAVAFRKYSNHKSHLLYVSHHLKDLSKFRGL